MRGKVRIITAGDYYHPVLVTSIDRVPTINELQDAVGGLIQIIPRFETIEEDGHLVKCVAFCNEEGKLNGLPPNGQAQTYWIQSRSRIYGAGRADPGDQLVGPVVVLTGDEEFFSEL